ncbi:MAG: hypothetical protein QMD85_00490, partial [Candidatus Aenigmarchaeota archaeon]|nr:hypothetical protein [Candidatus Aenigmarchaeota archaeon]MDI6721997.1 hypothetical protein [Candidatus Aenigmarchaeota archaeon]
KNIKAAAYIGFVNIAIRSSNRYIEEPEVRNRIAEILSDYSFRDLWPSATLDLMRANNQLFSRIFDKVASREGILSKNFDDVTFRLNSISFAVFRRITNKYPDLPENEINSRISEIEINSAISEVLEERRKFENKVVLGKDTHLITFVHEEKREDFENQPFIDFAKKRGVRDENIVHEDKGVEFKGPEAKNSIKNAIINSRNKGQTVIYANVHGNKDKISLGDSEGFSFGELADILSQRGRLYEVTLISSSCFSYDYAKNLLNELETRTATLSTIITTANKDRYSYGNAFLNSLTRLNIPDNQPLLGRHIYEAEKYADQYEDVAVFFSEYGINSIEIAENSINHQCPVCEGDLCPVSLG